MRKIEMRTTHITIDGKPAQEVSFAQIIQQVLHAAPDGMSVGDLRRAVRIIDAADAVWQRKGDALLLEDDDYAYLQRRWKETKFPLAQRAVVELDDAIDGATHVDPNAESERPSTTSKRGKG